MRAAQQPPLLGWFWHIRIFTDRDPHPSERSILPRKRTDMLSHGLWACVVPPSTMQHAVLLGRESWMRFNTRSYRALPPRPLDNRVLDELTLSHHTTAGLAVYAVDPAPSNGAFHFFYVGITGVTLSDEPQPLAVNLVRSNGSPALTGHYLVDILPQPDILSGQKHFVASGRQVLLLIGVADLEPGDLVGVTDSPILRTPLGALQHPVKVAGPHPGQTSDSQVSAVASSTDAEGIAPACAADLADGNGTFEPSPKFCIIKRLGPTPNAPAGDRVRLTRPLSGPPEY